MSELKNMTGMSEDIKELVQTAQTLFREASATTGEKAEKLRERGLELLESVASKAHEVQASIVDRSKEMATATDEYIHENPWKVVTITAALGFLAGLCLGRK